MAKRSTKRARVEKLDAAWARKVKEGVGHCEWTGCYEAPTDAHHVFGKKAFPRLRHDLDNGIALCRKCHDEWHAAPLSRRAWFAVRFPLVWMRLQAKVQREARLA